MKYSTSLKFKLPDGNDDVDINDINENFTKADTEIIDLKNKLQNSLTNVTKINEQLAKNTKQISTAQSKADSAYNKVTSATYIRDRVKAVDGHGSGLDADTVDGKHATGNLMTNEKNNLVAAINEVFTNGNNVKNNTVDALLSVDDSLPVTHNSSWSKIITEIGNIQTGLSEEGKIYPKIFVQTSQPIAIKKWDIWIKTSENINNIYFRDHEPPHITGVGWINIGDIDMSFNVLKGLQFLDENGSEITINYKTKMSAEKSSTKPKIWENGYMSIMANLNFIKYRKDDKWCSINASYWNGIKWVDFIQEDFYIYSGSYDDSVRKISPSGNEVWKYTGHDEAVHGVAVDKDGYVYSGSNDDSVRKISPSGNEVWKYTGHDKAVHGVAVDKDGYVYSGSYDDSVRKISPSGNEVWKYTGHDKAVLAVAVDKDGYVYSGSNDDSVRKISPSGNEVWKYTGHNRGVAAVAVDKYGYVYSGSYDDSVRKISPSGNEVWKYTGHNKFVLAVAVDPGLIGAFLDEW
ncbi:WD domain, G-beta repeat [Clostridium tepidiprofundi DSM 19306]|uniref:WD domain, G-beta repeat n=1 Tax=Clostridium tepidiprofundi DSM 19306 TaxID=1121338 RepID=A0A151B7W3_9CLOT|nr:PQQ-binding-like beta-propeller repeat protein [Clostridium tepidiprofundi]KYH35822.1 WD domain, G-beta repeat [Clostridium tepidiprofundi DSM 19306]